MPDEVVIAGDLGVLPADPSPVTPSALDRAVSLVAEQVAEAINAMSEHRDTSEAIRSHEEYERNRRRDSEREHARTLMEDFAGTWGALDLGASIDRALERIHFVPRTERSGAFGERAWYPVQGGLITALWDTRFAGEPHTAFSYRVNARLRVRYPWLDEEQRRLLLEDLHLPPPTVPRHDVRPRTPGREPRNRSGRGLQTGTGSGIIEATPSPNERSEMPATAEAPAFRPRLQIQDYMTNVVSELGYEVPQDELLFGLEWEMIAANGIPSLTAHLYDVQSQSRTFIAKYDGSVGSSGLELVTLPLALSQQMAFIDSVNMAEVRESRTCGVHIHITRRVLSEGQILRILNFINAGSPLMNKFITAVARRQENLYCRRTGVTYTDVARVRSSHYDAVGISHRHPTLELRIFKTTNNAQYLKSYVQFAHALVAYNALETVVARPAHSITDPQDFCAYVLANRAQYPDLSARISRTAYNEFRGLAPVVRQPRIASVARVSAVTGYRERRAQSVVPTTATVAGWIMTNVVGVVIPADSSAAQGALWMRRHVRHALVSRYAYWYAENCMLMAGGPRFTLVTATGRQVQGAGALRGHALYHLELVDH